MINQLISGNIILRINEQKWIAIVSDRKRERNPLEKYIEIPTTSDRGNFRWKNYSIIISIPKRIGKKALKDPAVSPWKMAEEKSTKLHTHRHTHQLKSGCRVSWNFSIMDLAFMCLCKILPVHKDPVNKLQSTWI